MTAKKLTVFTSIITAAVLAIWSFFPAQAVEHGYDTGGLFCCGLVPVENSNYDWGYIDVLGREIIGCQYDAASDFDEYGVAAVQKNGKYYLIDPQGRKIVNCSYDIIDFNSIRAGTYIVENDGKASIIDNYGSYILPPKYEHIEHFINGLSKVCLDGKWGFMNDELEIVIPCTFDKVGNFYIPEYTTAMTDGKWGIIDSAGEWVIEPQYELMFTPFSAEWFGVFDNDHYFYIDTSGKVISDFYSDFTEWEQNGFPVQDNETPQPPEREYKYPYTKEYTSESDGDICRVIDGSGRTVFTIEADYISEFQPDGYAVFDKDYKHGIVDRFGRVVVPAIYEGISAWNMDDY